MKKRQNLGDTQGAFALSPQDLLLLCSEELDNIEASRMLIDNQRRSLVSPKVVGKKGGSFGKGLPEDHAVPSLMSGVVEAMEKLERDAVKKLEKAVRLHPLYAWIERSSGVGEKQGARLLAAIGDPSTRATVSQLWAYCGYHVIDGQAPRRRAGKRANWSPTAKMRAFLIAESAMKAGVRKDDETNDEEGYDLVHRRAVTPYGKVYLEGRAKYAEALHPVDCHRCGPEGKPAPEGSPLSDGHKNARALRLVAKEILKDIWIEARRATSDAEPVVYTPGEPRSVVLPETIPLPIPNRVTSPAPLSTDAKAIALPRKVSHPSTISAETTNGAEPMQPPSLSTLSGESTAKPKSKPRSTKRCSPRVMAGPASEGTA